MRLDEKWIRAHLPEDCAAEDIDVFSGFERYLKNLKCGFPPARWEEKVEKHIHLMNYWYAVPHWDYDRDKLCFIEISDAKEHDHHDMTEEPRPGSIIKIVD